MGKIAFLLAVLLVGLTITLPSPASEGKYTLTEKPIVEVNFSSCDSHSIVLSPDGRRVAYRAKASNKL